MLDSLFGLFDKIPVFGSIDDQIQLMVAGAIATSLAGLLAKKGPKDKMAAAIKWTEVKLNFLVECFGMVVSMPCYGAGLALSKFLLAKLSKGKAEKLEQGLFVTAALWVKELWELLRKFINQILLVITECFDKFLEGLLADNEKRKAPAVDAD